MPDAEDLCQVLKQMIERLEKTTIVVDGIDECQQQDAAAVTTLLVSLQTDATKEVHIALLGRDEQYIRDSMERTGFSLLSIAAHKNDLIMYVVIEMKQKMADGRFRVKSKNLEGLIIDRLVNEAHGM